MIYFWKTYYRDFYPFLIKALRSRSIDESIYVIWFRKWSYIWWRVQILIRIFKIVSSSISYKNSGILTFFFLAHSFINRFWKKKYQRIPLLWKCKFFLKWSKNYLRSHRTTFMLWFYDLRSYGQLLSLFYV